MHRKNPLLLVLTVLTLLLIQSCTNVLVQHAEPNKQSVDLDPDLEFDVDAYTVRTLQLDGRPVVFRAYEGIVYVARPVDLAYQRMNIYVPVEYYQGKSLGGYTAKTAPIFLPYTVGGYMPGKPDRPGQGREGGTNAALVALSKGYVVAAPGARGRTTKDGKGRYLGKAPAGIVDLKAAVRFLRHHDRRMPGDAEKIIANGASAGGAFAALLGVTGNSPDYESYLRSLGAAEERDDVFAASCYSPVTDLEHADMAYEWQFQGVNDYKKMVFGRMVDWHVERKEVKGFLSVHEIAVSRKLAALFPSYLNSLGLRDAAGQWLTMNSDGSGPFQDLVAGMVMVSGQGALDAGRDLSDRTWLTISGGKVRGIDFRAYVRFINRVKKPPAFDALDLGSGENSLFGSSMVDARHFTNFTVSAIASTMTETTSAEKKVVAMMNPLGYIGVQSVTTAKHWRIRQGTLDRDTPLAVPVILATMLKNRGYAVDFALSWDRSHGGGYDLDELFAWIDGIVRE